MSLTPLKIIFLLITTLLAYQSYQNFQLNKVVPMPMTKEVHTTTRPQGFDFEHAAKKLKEFEKLLAEDTTSQAIQYFNKNLKGLERDKNGNSPLQLALIFNNEEVVKYILNFDINLQEKNGEGLNSFDLARIHGNKEILDLLYKKNEGLDLRNRKEDRIKK